MPQFNPDSEIPDLDGKVCLVTGGNSGIGEAIVTAIAQHNPSKIYLAARSKTRAEEAISRIRATSAAAKSANIEVLDLDLSSMESVKTAAAKFNAENDRLDILQLNGGVASIPYGVTKDGYEIQFATNYLGHMLLTQLLMPKLLSTSKLPGADVRVVAVSSVASKVFIPKQGILFDELNTSMANRQGMQLYGQTNLARTLFAYKMAEKYPSITSTSIHPGTVKSNIWGGDKNMPWILRNLIFGPVVYFTGVTNEVGAKGQLWAAFTDKKHIDNGAYYEPVGKRADGPLSRDEKLATKLWEWTETELAKHGGIGWPKA